MNRKWVSGIVSSLLLATALQAAVPAGGDFVITKSTIDGGGGQSAGGNFVLNGTIGQHDAGTSSMINGDYSLAGGFWARAVEIADLLFKDGFE